MHDVLLRVQPSHEGYQALKAWPDSLINDQL